MAKPGPQPMLRTNEMFCSKDLLKGHIKACGNINVAKQEQECQSAVNEALNVRERSRSLQAQDT